MRRVSGDTDGQRHRCARAPSARASIRGAPRASPSEDHSASAAGAPGRGDGGSGGWVGGAAASAFAVSVTDAIERFDLSEFRIDRLELLAEALDVAIDRSVIDIDVLAIGRIHQLVAVFDVPRTLGQRFEDQELGHGQLDRLAAPGAQMAARIERHLTADDDRLALPLLALARQFAAADQRTNALDQQALRKR